MLVEDLHAEIPEGRVAQAAKTSVVLGKSIVDKYPFVDGATPTEAPNLQQYLLNLTWRPQLSITGAEGLPALMQAGNVLRPYTSLKLSMRVPPSLDAKVASAQMKKVIEASANTGNPSYREFAPGYWWIALFPLKRGPW